MLHFIVCDNCEKTTEAYCRDGRDSIVHYHTPPLPPFSTTEEYLKDILKSVKTTLCRDCLNK